MGTQLNPSYGSIMIGKGRFVARPNCYSHELQYTKLKDESKSGHFKMVTLQLVDPNVRILPTANVPPQ